MRAPVGAYSLLFFWQILYSLSIGKDIGHSKKVSSYKTAIQLPLTKVHFSFLTNIFVQL